MRSSTIPSICLLFIPIFIIVVALTQTCYADNDVLVNKPEKQWVISCSPSCSACTPFISKLKDAAALANTGYEVSDKDSAHFKIVKITDAEWRKRGIVLPHAELFVKGKSVETRTGDKLVIKQMIDKLKE